MPSFPATTTSLFFSSYRVCTLDHSAIFTGDRFPPPSPPPPPPSRPSPLCLCHSSLYAEKRDRYVLYIIVCLLVGFFYAIPSQEFVRLGYDVLLYYCKKPISISEHTRDINRLPVGTPMRACNTPSLRTPYCSRRQEGWSFFSAHAS